MRGAHGNARPRGDAFPPVWGTTATGATHTKTVLTAGPASALRLTADRGTICASRNDLAYVTVEVVDAAGRLVPRARARVDFGFTGDGELYRVGSGDPRDLGSFEQPHRTTYRGQALAVLRPSGAVRASAGGGAGTMTLTATATGLRAASVTVQTESC